MAPKSEAFQELIRQIRARVPEAERKLVGKLEPYLRDQIRRFLAPQVRTVLDSDDLLQEVWKAFFARIVPKYTFDSPAHMKAFLAEVARLQTLQANRHHLDCEKRDVRRVDSEVSLEELCDQVVCRDPGPLAAAMDNDVWEQCLQAVDEEYRPALLLLREGHTPKEIARKLHMSRRFVILLLRVTLLQPFIRARHEIRWCLTCVARLDGITTLSESKYDP